MSHPRIVTVPTFDHHDTLGFALSLEKMRQALHSGAGVRLDLHLSGEALTWVSDAVLAYERLDQSGRHISVALDGKRARQVFAQLVQTESMGCDEKPIR